MTASIAASAFEWDSGLNLTVSGHGEILGVYCTTLRRTKTLVPSAGIVTVT